MEVRIVHWLLVLIILELQVLLLYKLVVFIRLRLHLHGLLEHGLAALHRVLSIKASVADQPFGPGKLAARIVGILGSLTSALDVLNDYLERQGKS